MVTFLTVVGVILTLIGVKMTYRAKGGKYADKKSLGIGLGIHAAIWLAGFFLFGVVTWALDKAVKLVVLVIALIVAYIWFSGGKEDTGNSFEEQQEDTGNDLSRMPNIMYSDGYNRWQLQHRNHDSVVYHDDNGNTIFIRHATISGGTIQTDQGTFQNYRA